MHRSVPVQSKLLEKKWVRRVQSIEQRKLKAVKAATKVTEPPLYSHMLFNPKKDQMREGNSFSVLTNSLDRFVEIEKHNHVLLEKLSTILVQNGPLSSPKAHNRSIASAGSGSSKQTGKLDLPPLKPSLNSKLRRDFQQKIFNDNARILKKLQDSKPFTTRGELEKEDKKY